MMWARAVPSPMSTGSKTAKKNIVMTAAARNEGHSTIATSLRVRLQVVAAGISTASSRSGSIDAGSAAARPRRRGPLGGRGGGDAVDVNAKHLGLLASAP